MRPPIGSSLSSRPLRIRSSVVAGSLIAAGFFGAFGSWAALAPLDSAVVVSGVIKVEGERKVVQHLEGGIIADLVVHEGDQVRAGDVLIRLDDTQARARLSLLESRLATRQALAARLRAERDNVDAIAFPASLLANDGEPAAGEAVRIQSELFAARRRALTGQQQILARRIEQTRDEIEGLDQLTKAHDHLIETLQDEADDLEGLFDKGLATRERFMALRRRQAELEGERAVHIASIARLHKAISEIEQQAAELTITRLNEVVTQLSQVEAELFDIEQQVRSAEDILTRTLIRASVGGTIMDMKVHSQFGVVEPGKPLLDIVPNNPDLVLEARLRPEDLDDIAPDLPVGVRILAYDVADMPMLNGHVVRVSADRLIDERSGNAYFTVLVRLADGEEARLAGEVAPGMAADAIISTGSRTLLAYLLAPLTRGLDRALKES